MSELSKISEKLSDSYNIVLAVLDQMHHLEAIIQAEKWYRNYKHSLKPWPTMTPILAGYHNLST